VAESFERWWERSGRAGLAVVLLETWDPVGVRDVDLEPEAEYLFEAADLESLVRERAGAAAIADRLGTLAVGLSAWSDRARDRAAADAVWAWAQASAP
jgi:hypothetical protein